MKKTKILALVLIAALLVGSAISASASGLSVDLLELDFATARTNDDANAAAGNRFTAGDDYVEFSGEWAPWIRVPLATPVNVPVSALNSTHVSFDIDLDTDSAENARVMIGLIVSMQYGENDWHENLNFFRAHGVIDPMTSATNEGSHTIRALLDLGLDNMPMANHVSEMTEFNGYFRIEAMTIIADGDVTVNEFRVHGATAGGTPAPTPSPTPGAPSGGGGSGNNAPTQGNPKTFDATSPYALFLGGALLLTAGVIFAPKLIKKTEK